MRKRALTNLWCGHVGLHAFAVVSLAFTQVFVAMWTHMPALPHRGVIPSDLGGPAPWVGLLGELPVVRSMAVIYAVWCILVFRRYLVPDTGLGLATACYGVMARYLGVAADHLSGPFYESIGGNLIVVGDLASVIGVAATVLVGWLSFRSRRTVSAPSLRM